ncbi:MAG: 50S ribosomal protein L22 [Candidatus Omnitrophica bacterium]|nr:50S ribosomal protein L22 [Candidatus Omnitrophota bacterium]
MISQASVKFIRIAPRKVRYVIDLIRKKSVREAQAILSGSPRRAGGIISKLLNQAIDAAEKNSRRNAGELYVSKVMADGGPSMRRFRAASMGRASLIHKRTSHIVLELDLLKKAVAAPPAITATKKEPKKTAAAGSKNKKLVGAK